MRGLSSIAAFLQLTLINLVLFLAPTSLQAPTSVQAQDSKSLGPREVPVHIVHRFPPGTWVENLSVRQSKGTILATTLTPKAQLFEVHPKTNQASLVHAFPGVTGLLGIAQPRPDVFYVAGGNFSFKTFEAAPGSSAVWEVDLTGKTTAVNLVASFPNAAVLNGMCVLSSEVILLADSGLGLVYSLNVKTKAQKVAIQDPTMKNATLGINGIHVWRDHLYYTNSDSAKFYKIPIDLKEGTPTGPAVLIYAGIPSDDFILDKKGDAYLCANSENELFLLPDAAAGNPGTLVATLEAGSVNSTELAGVSAAEFGRDGWLYMSTTGGVSQYLTGNFTLGGSISRVFVSH